MESQRSPPADVVLRPILTPKTVLPLFFAIGIIFAPIGGLLLYASAQVSITIAHIISLWMGRPDYRCSV